MAAVSPEEQPKRPQNRNLQELKNKALALGFLCPTSDGLQPSSDGHPPTNHSNSVTDGRHASLR